MRVLWTAKCVCERNDCKIVENRSRREKIKINCKMNNDFVIAKVQSSCVHAKHHIHVHRQWDRHRNALLRLCINDVLVFILFLASQEMNH